MNQLLRVFLYLMVLLHNLIINHSFKLPIVVLLCCFKVILRRSSKKIKRIGILRDLTVWSLLKFLKWNETDISFRIFYSMVTISNSMHPYIQSFPHVHFFRLKEKWFQPPEVFLNERSKFHLLGYKKVFSALLFTDNCYLKFVLQVNYFCQEKTL